MVCDGVYMVVRLLSNSDFKNKCDERKIFCTCERKSLTQFICIIYLFCLGVGGDKVRSMNANQCIRPYVMSNYVSDTKQTTSYCPLKM